MGFGTWPCGSLLPAVAPAQIGAPANDADIQCATGWEDVGNRVVSEASDDGDNLIVPAGKAGGGWEMHGRTLPMASLASQTCAPKMGMYFNRRKGGAYVVSCEPV